MSFQPKAPHKKRRWLALLVFVAIGTGMVATTALAAPITFVPSTFVPDDEGANDEPGQKDLTAQASQFNGGFFYSAWKWDDTSWSGNNTGDACSLFDTDSDGLVNYAVCLTIGRPAVEKSTRVYSCGDTRSDRCTGSVLAGTEGAQTLNWCDANSATGQFGGTDTLAVCNISNVVADTGLTDLNNATLLNSCSYPSQQPNSDPSDCVLTITNLDTSVGTLSSGTTTWSATLNDTATLNPASATGSVVFKLWTTNLCNDAAPVWESAAVALVGGVASTVGAGTTSGTNVITNATVDADGVYFWTADYTPTGAFNGSSSPCGETTTITAASVAGGS